MKPTEELGEWRRTHYSSQITPDSAGTTVTYFGWVGSVRNQTNIAFLIVRDKDGSIQVTIPKRDAPKGVLDAVEGITEHSSVGIRGVVKAMPKAPGGVEIIPTEIKVLAMPVRLPPFKMQGSEVPSLDRRLDMRPVDLRRDRVQAIFRLRNTVLHSIRRFFIENGFFEIQTPKLIGSATEGGAALFSVLYYNQPAFLVQSPQLYKEEMVIPFEKVFEIGPVFRAEESRTQYHLSEVTSIDAEQAFVSYHDVMDTLEEMVRVVVGEAFKSPSSGVFKDKSQKIHFDDIKQIPRFTYSQILDKLKESGNELAWGEDLTSRVLAGLDDMSSSFYFITDWPSASKPFYIKPSPRDPQLTESFDLMYGALELASGGSRISSKKDLIKRLKEQKLKPQAFEYHLRAFDYGMPPHAGFAVGLERLMMALTGEDNIREVTLFPRDKIRLAP